MHAVVAFNKRVTKVVDHKALKALQWTILKVEVVWVAHVVLGAVGKFLLVPVDYFVNALLHVLSYDVWTLRGTPRLVAPAGRGLGARARPAPGCNFG